MKLNRGLNAARTLVLIGALLITPRAAASDVPERCCERCNVVIVTFDALRADRLGAYGYGKNTSPRLDAFAAEAHVFLDAVSQSGTTASSLPSLFTSRFPKTDRIIHYGRRFGLRPRETTLAEILQATGYHTAAVVGHEFARSKYGLGQGFDLYADQEQSAELGERTVERALTLLAGLDEPFLLWVHIRHPHSPYDATPEDFAELYDAAPGEPPALESSREELLAWFSEREPVTKMRFLGGKHSLTPSMVRQYRARYDASIRLGDRAFGRLTDALEELHLTERSVVIVGADHAESLGGHGIFDHNALFYDVIHVPLMLRLPSREHAEQSYPVMNVDIVPTLLNLLGLGARRNMRGRDLFDADREDYVQLAEYEHSSSVRLGPYRLIQGAKTSLLFDLSVDPDELTDISAARPDLVAKLLQLLPGSSRPQPHSELMEKLKSLGYIE